VAAVDGELQEVLFTLAVQLAQPPEDLEDRPITPEEMDQLQILLHLKQAQLEVKLWR
jgi:hypothetical protein